MRVLIIGSSSKIYNNLKKRESQSSIDFYEVTRSKPSSLKLLDNCIFFDVVISFVHILDNFDENKKFYKTLELKIRKNYNRFIYIGSPVINHSGFILSNGNHLSLIL